MMTQHRFMKRRELVMALGWVAEIELALISFYGDSVPDPGMNWDVERQAREIDIRLERVRWAEEQQEKDYGGRRAC